MGSKENKRTVTINGEALRLELRKRGLLGVTVSKAIGYDQTYISHAIKDNRVARSAVLLLQTMYNINPDIYVVKEEPKTEEVKAEVAEVVQHVGLTDDDFQKLYKVIYTAVYEATKRALSE